jgi:transposase InsO family protein
LIAGLRCHHKLAVLLQVAGLARSTFYYQCKVICTEQQKNMEANIRATYDEHKGRYGYRRITAELRHSMEKPVNHKCVQRLMQKMGLRALIRAKKRSRNISGMSDEHIPNVLQRDFSATAPNQKWVTDVTEFNVNGQKLYLSACMDLYNGEIIAHRMARRPVFELVSGTLQAALSRLEGTTGLTVHSDQGWHYKMQPYRSLLARRGVTQSMSRKGNCFDNAAIESFFGTLKAEYFHLETLDDIESLEAGVQDYIRYYNYERIKLRLQGLSPVEYRLRNTT